MTQMPLIFVFVVAGNIFVLGFRGWYSGFGVFHYITRGSWLVIPKSTVLYSLFGKFVSVCTGRKKWLGSLINQLDTCAIVQR